MTLDIPLFRSSDPARRYSGAWALIYVIVVLAATPLLALALWNIIQHHSGRTDIYFLGSIMVPAALVIPNSKGPRSGDLTSSAALFGWFLTVNHLGQFVLWSAALVLSWSR